MSDSETTDEELEANREAWADQNDGTRCGSCDGSGARGLAVCTDCGGHGFLPSVDLT